MGFRNENANKISFFIFPFLRLQLDLVKYNEQEKFRGCYILSRTVNRFLENSFKLTKNETKIKG